MKPTAVITCSTTRFNISNFKQFITVTNAYGGANQFYANTKVQAKLGNSVVWQTNNTNGNATSGPLTLVAGQNYIFTFSDPNNTPLAIVNATAPNCPRVVMDTKAVSVRPDIKALKASE